ncbi:MAG: phosphatase PAP2 family protein [Magnetococcus sp. WYHC-3]
MSHWRTFHWLLFLILLASCVAALIWNHTVFFVINGLGGARWLDLLAAHVTTLGYGFVLCVLLFMLMPRQPVAALLALEAFVTSGLAVQLIKYLSPMPRPLAVFPDMVHVIGPALKAGSFPSGHAASAVAVALTLHLLLPWDRVFTRGLLMVLAALVALSRVYVGVHFPLDVLAGAAWGALAALLAVRQAPALERWLGKLSLDAGMRLQALMMRLLFLAGLFMGLFYRPLADVSLALAMLGGAAMASAWWNHPRRTRWRL